MSTVMELCSTMGAFDEDVEVVYLRAFSFSLTGKAKTWLQSHPKKSLNIWEEVEEKIITGFFPPSKFISAKSTIATFSKGSMNLYVKHGRDSDLYCGGAQTIVLMMLHNYKFSTMF